MFVNLVGQSGALLNSVHHKLNMNECEFNVIIYFVSVTELTLLISYRFPEMLN